MSSFQAMSFDVIICSPVKNISKISHLVMSFLVIFGVTLGSISQFLPGKGMEGHPQIQHIYRGTKCQRRDPISTCSFLWEDL